MLKLYRSTSASPPAFGEVWIVCVVETVNPHLHPKLLAETYVLFQRGEPRLMKMRFEIGPDPLRDDAVGEMGIEEADERAYELGKSMVADRLAERYEKLQTMLGVVANGFEFTSAEEKDLVNRWLLGRLHEQLKQVRDATKSQQLRVTLDRIMKIAPLISQADAERGYDRG